MGVWLVAAVVHVFLRAEQRLLTWPLSYLALEALAGLSLAYRAAKSVGRTRVAWGLVAASALLEVPNLLLTALHYRGLLPAWVVGATSYLSLTTGMLVLAGILSFPVGQKRGGLFRRRVLDSLVFAAALLFLLWVMGIHASLQMAGRGMGLRVFSAYLNVALLGGGLVFMTSYHPDCIRGPLGWLGASALAWLGAISCWTLMGLPPVVARQSWIIIAGAIPLFQGLAAWSTKSVEDSLPEAEVGGRLAGLLSYLPVSIAVAVLAALLAWAPQQVNREAYAIFLAMVMLLLLRQFQAIQDLQAARQTLAERVQQRTLALEQAQEAMLRTERMNTLALMGAGLAHDLNNLLGAVKGSADLAVMNLEDGLAPRKDELERIAMAAERASLLTRRLMEFARREKEELLPMDLGPAVQEMEATLRLLLPKSVAFLMQMPTQGPLTVLTSRIRLEQMLVNLVANAGDAMPGGGILRIRVDHAGSDLDEAMIEVMDSGVGMTAEVLARIFDPFFTTKAPGKGTGLGLSSLKAMVEEGGGRLEVESAPGQGTRFRILVPRLPDGALSPR
ncbi:sensor histidine kinase [Geothrix sp. PMB-07]|uniref:sensor histidine kinase n=1 Tax=Geothrix sp. PMB-07 TaxID=3068640 RepID=UPI00274178B1|nr:ATP-binding protein [Geothrix sp. PMB-07]WLT32163.1 ATP-binding protein [Geothrix sp. PMB-07]